MPVVAGIDSSTQSTKVELRDLDTGALVSSGRAAHPSTTPPRSEQPPAAWWDALSAAMAAATTDAPAGADVAALSVAGQQHGLVLTDAGLSPLRAAKLWNDTESAPQAERLLDVIGAAAWAERTGSVPTAAFTVTKLAWVAEHEPALVDGAAHLLLPHDWLTGRLVGRAVTDRGDASGTGWFDPAEGAWLTDLLDLAVGPAHARGERWTDALPVPLGTAEPAGETREGVVVGPGTGDNMAAALGLGLEPGDVAISLGTSGTAFSVSTTPTADATGAVAGFADATGRFLPLVCTLNCTKVTDAFARLLGVGRERLEAMALQAAPGAGAVVLVPYLDGERTPNRPHATGTLVGLRSDTSPEQVARAAHEGVVCGLLDGLDALSSAGVDTGGRVLLVGGGARSSAYRQILADLLGRPVHVPPVDAEWVAAGAAVQAAAVATASAPSTVAERWGLTAGAVTVEPSPAVDAEAVRAAYREAAAGSR